MALPITGGKITTPFAKPGKLWSTGRHEGVDFACPKGTKILACADGKVVGTGIWGSAYGPNSLVIKHVVNGQTLYTMYAHGQKLYVKKGDKVKLGQHVLDSGAMGNVTGPHLHLECQAKPRWTRGGGINPAGLLGFGGGATAPAPTSPVAAKPSKVAKPSKKYPGKPVKPGDKGPHIVALREALKLGAGDTYDAAAVKAVKKIQKATPALGTPDGIMGPKSWKHIVK
jgi:murein DD-endopeptidase MepM/ murein hydrolase activator NlpD